MLRIVFTVITITLMLIGSFELYAAKPKPTRILLVVRLSSDVSSVAPTVYRSDNYGTEVLGEPICSSEENPDAFTAQYNRELEYYSLKQIMAEGYQMGYLWKEGFFEGADPR